MNAKSFVIPAAPQASIPVVGESKSYPVRRIWCVGRNYLEHIREMGNDERAPPFFFAKHADMLVPDGATIPYGGAVRHQHVGVLGEEERRCPLVIAHLADMLEIIAPDAPDTADRIGF